MTFKGPRIVEKGDVFRLHRSNLVVAITEYRTGGTFTALVLNAPAGSSYPKGGYDIVLFPRELAGEATLVDFDALTEPVES